MDKVLLILQYQVNPIRCSLDFISTKIYCQIISQAGRVGHIHPIHIPSLSACTLQSSLKQEGWATYTLFTSHLCQPVISSHFSSREGRSHTSYSHPICVSLYSPVISYIGTMTYLSLFNSVLALTIGLWALLPQK